MNTDKNEVDQKRCSYCGAVVSPAFYFCKNCGTPYTKIEFVLPKVSAPYLTDETRVRRVAPNAIKIFWLYMAVLLGILIVGLALFGLDLDGSAYEVFASIVLTAVTLVLTVFHFKTLKPQLKIFGFFKTAFWVGLPVLAICLGVNYLYHVKLIEFLGLSELIEEESYRSIFPSYLAAVFFVAVIPGITEEIAFRGLVQHWLHEALSPAKAIGFASFLFAIAHFSVFSLPYLFAVGVLLGWLKWKTGSLYPSMIIHFLHNWAVITWFE